MTFFKSGESSEELVVLDPQPLLLLHFVCHLLLENLNNLLTAALGLIKLCNCSLMLLLDSPKFFQSFRAYWSV
jgi:hypothetical protein